MHRVPDAWRTTRQRSLPAALVAAVAISAVLGPGCSWFGPDVGADGVDVKSVEVDGQNGRDAVLVAPEGHFDEPAGKLPLVLVLHGLGQDAEQIAQETEWPEAARDEGFLAVFPQGYEESWNAGRCCGAAAGENVADVAFIDTLIAQMVAEENADPERVYVTGFSNGAMFSFLYACLTPDTLAGAASVAGTNFSDCEPDGSVDFMQVSGRDDPVVPVLGGESSLVGVPEVPSVERSLLAMADAAGCTDLNGLEIGGVMSFQEGGCVGGTSVRFDVLEGFGHFYPTAENSPGYVAVDKILEFWGLTSA